MGILCRGTSSFSRHVPVLSPVLGLVNRWVPSLADAMCNPSTKNPGQVLSLCSGSHLEGDRPTQEVGCRSSPQARQAQQARAA